MRAIAPRNYASSSFDDLTSHNATNAEMNTQFYSSTLVFRLLFALAILCNDESFAQGRDWPQFRGAQRDGKTSEIGLLKTWPEDAPKVLWRVPLGEGYSSISITNGLAFTMFDHGNDEYLACFEAATGKEEWRVRTDAKFRNSWGNGPRATPTFSDGMIYAVSANAKLYAVETLNGKIVWQHDLPREYGGSRPDLGYSNSPLVEGDLLLVTGCGGAEQSLFAFERKTGVLRWASYSDHPGYSSPIVIEALGRRQAVFFAGTSIVAVSPREGKVLWIYPWRTNDYENVATPVFFDQDKLFFSSAHAQAAGAAVLQMKTSNGKIAAEAVWQSNVMQHHFASSIFHEGFLYGTDRAILKCIEASTGKERWQQRGFGEGSLIFADGHLLVLGTNGTLALVEATPTAYREKARAQILSGKCYTAPALAHGRLYLRNEDEMVCLELRRE